MRSVYYNDNDAYCAEWLRKLIAAGHLPAGEVDGRDVREVTADDLEGYGQAHFFAGIGGWPYALELAGWEGSVWTASIPCQPLSSAGRRKGHADERHLWPAFYRLVAERRPPVIFGEQVASKDGREWLAGVRADLVQLGYAVGAADLPAASVGAPHIRQRLWWVAYATDSRRQHEPHDRSADIFAQDVVSQESGQQFGHHGTSSSGLGVPNRSGSQPREQASEAVGHGRTAEPTSDPSGLGDPARGGRSEECADAPGSNEGGGSEGSTKRLRGDGGPSRLADAAGEHGRPGAGRKDRSQTGDGSRLGHTDAARSQGRSFNAGQYASQRLAGPTSPWDAFDLIPCADGKTRRVEPGSFPLAHGVPARVGRLRAYGNAIVPQIAAEFVRAFMGADAEPLFEP